MIFDLNNEIRNECIRLAIAKRVIQTGIRSKMNGVTLDVIEMVLKHCLVQHCSLVQLCASTANFCLIIGCQTDEN